MQCLVRSDPAVRLGSAKCYRAEIAVWAAFFFFFFPSIPFECYSLHYGSRVVLSSLLRSLGSRVKDSVFRKHSSSKDFSICSGFIAAHMALNYCTLLFFGKAVNVCRRTRIRCSIV